MSVEEQEEELESMSEIFDEQELEIHEKGTKLPIWYPNDEEHDVLTWKSGILRISPELETCLKLTIPKTKASLSVEFLPPIELYFWFPPKYPQEQAPKFLLVCSWLTRLQLSVLAQQLDTLWEDTQDCILFSFGQYLKEESLETLQISDSFELLPAKEKATVQEVELLRDVRTYQPQMPLGALIHLLQEYNSCEKQRRFEALSLNCTVCFSERPGADCVQFKNCGHAFCKECVAGYFESQIQEREVRQLMCLDPECKKEVQPNEIKAVVSAEAFQRYDKLLLDLSLGEMEDVMSCPRVHCQKPVFVEKGESMGSCEYCKYTFCILCRKAWHGINPCKSSDLFKFAKEYPSATEERKAFLDKVYGKQNILRIIAEMASQEYVQEHSKPCPSCGAAICKYDGCNKVHCTYCKNYFCWLCNKTLSKENPYKHFSTSACTGRLFDGIEDVRDDEVNVDGDEDFINMFGEDGEIDQQHIQWLMWQDEFNVM